MKKRNFIITFIMALVSLNSNSQVVAGVAEYIVDVNESIFTIIYDHSQVKKQEYLNVDLNDNDSIDIQFEVLVDFASDTIKMGAYLKILNPNIKICDLFFLPVPIFYNKGDDITNKCDSLSNQSLVLSEYAPKAGGQFPYTKVEQDTTYLGFQWQNKNTIYEGWLELGYSINQSSTLRLFSIGSNKALNVKTFKTTLYPEVKNEKEEFIVYPNPVNDGVLKFIIKQNNKTKYKLEISNQLGEIIYKNGEIYSNKHEEISIKNINSGIYFLTLKGKSKVILRKIIIR